MMNTRRITYRVRLGPLLLASAFVCAPASSQTAAPPSTATKPPVARKAKPKAASGPALASDSQNILYMIGAFLGRSVSTLDLGEAELVLVRQGLSDAASGRPLRASPETWGPKIPAYTKKRLADVAAAEKKKSAPFFEKEAAQPGTLRQPSGFLFRELAPGSGAGPAPGGKVLVKYTGTLADGTVFESTARIGRPVVLDLTQVIPCLKEALTLMKGGGRARIVCPGELGWGEAGQPPLVKPGATVAFDLELVDLVK